MVWQGERVGGATWKPCNDRGVVASLGNRRLIGYMMIAVLMVVAGVGLSLFRSRSGSTNEENEVLHALIERTSPGMCEMQRRVNSNDRSGALNVFYDEVHQGSHVLASELTKTTSPEAGSFLQAKARVEADLRTLAPTLKQNVDAFAAELHTALDVYEPGLWRPCAA